ncbi:hypothetical protein [Novosphingobium rosa]|uniref:hypothetical protein n=1 Tax=Novosphingobium rosa TaxID=76978 RepID=UPI001470CFA8|nr:hypothetical protein [Novosphingobium rosa]
MTSVVEDPCGLDEADDAVIVTTRRSLSRIAFVAAETAARFLREGIEYDPVAWMMAGRELFEGSCALDACLGRQAFMRAAILHGLSWGLDASPSEIDPFIDDDDDDTFGADGEPDHAAQPLHQAVEPKHMSRIRSCETNLRVTSCRSPELRMELGKSGRAHDQEEACINAFDMVVPGKAQF